MKLFLILTITLFSLSSYSQTNSAKYSNKETKNVINSIANPKVLLDALITYKGADKKAFSVFKKYGVSPKASLPQLVKKGRRLYLKGGSNWFDFSKARQGIYIFNGRELAVNIDRSTSQNLERLFQFVQKNVKTAKTKGIPFLIDEAVAEESSYDQMPTEMAKGLAKFAVGALNTVGAGYLYFKLITIGGAKIAAAGLGAKAIVGAALIAASLVTLEHVFKRTRRAVVFGRLKLVCHKGTFAILEDRWEGKTVHPYKGESKTRHGKALERVLSTNLTLFEQLAGGKVCKDPSTLSKFNKAVNHFSRYLLGVNKEETERIEKINLGVEQ